MNNFYWLCKESIPTVCPLSKTPKKYKALPARSVSLYFN